MMVTFLFDAEMVPGNTNALQVIDEIQATRSAISVSGFRLSFTTRRPAGSLRQAAASRCVSALAARASLAAGKPHAIRCRQYVAELYACWPRAPRRDRVSPRRLMRKRHGGRRP